MPILKVNSKSKIVNGNSSIHHSPLTINRKAKGFTLIEILIVITIIGILATVGLYSFDNARQKARDSKRKQDLQTIKTALVLYYQDFRQYPPSCQGSSCQAMSFASSASSNWIPELEDYLPKAPKDPRQASAANFLDHLTLLQPVYAAHLCTNSPGAVVTNNPALGRSWTIPDNAKASDNLYANSTLAVFNDSTDYLKASNFGFAIPTTATINGVVVEVERYSPGSIRDASIRLVKNGFIAGDDKINRATGLDWPAPTDTNTYVSYGGSTDLWGLSLTPADINATNFGVVYRAWRTGTGIPDSPFGVPPYNASIDHICMKVYYTAPAPPPPPPPPPTGGDCSSAAAHTYCYSVSANRLSFVLWAQLENSKNQEIFNKPNATCSAPPPSNTQLNYCLPSPSL